MQDCRSCQQMYGFNHARDMRSLVQVIETPLHPDPLTQDIDTVLYSS